MVNGGGGSVTTGCSVESDDADGDGAFTACCAITPAGTKANAHIKLRTLRYEWRPIRQNDRATPRTMSPLLYARRRLRRLIAPAASDATRRRCIFGGTVGQMRLTCVSGKPGHVVRRRSAWPSRPGARTRKLRPKAQPTISLFKAGPCRLVGLTV